MFGTVAKYLFGYILGIRQRNGTVGYADLIIALLEISLTQISGFIETKDAKVLVGYKTSNNGIKFRVEMLEKNRGLF